MGNYVTRGIILGGLIGHCLLGWEADAADDFVFTWEDSEYRAEEDTSDGAEESEREGEDVAPAHTVGGSDFELGFNADISDDGDLDSEDQPVSPIRGGSILSAASSQSGDLAVTTPPPELSGEDVVPEMQEPMVAPPPPKQQEPIAAPIDLLAISEISQVLLQAGPIAHQNRTNQKTVAAYQTALVAATQVAPDAVPALLSLAVTAVSKLSAYQAQLPAAPTSVPPAHVPHTPMQLASISYALSVTGRNISIMSQLVTSMTQALTLISEKPATASEFLARVSVSVDENPTHLLTTLQMVLWLTKEHPTCYAPLFAAFQVGTHSQTQKSGLFHTLFLLLIGNRNISNPEKTITTVLKSQQIDPTSAFGINLLEVAQIAGNQKMHDALVVFALSNEDAVD